MYCEQFLPFNFRTYPQQDTFYKTERGGGSGSSEMLKQACLSEVYGRKPEDSHVELTFPRKILVMSLSWNFPALAELSYEGAEPSWGTLIFELKPS